MATSPRQKKIVHPGHCLLGAMVKLPLSRSIIKMLLGCGLIKKPDLKRRIPAAKSTNELPARLSEQSGRGPALAGRGELSVYKQGSPLVQGGQPDFTIGAVSPFSSSCSPNRALPVPLPLALASFLVLLSPWIPLQQLQWQFHGNALLLNLEKPVPWFFLIQAPTIG